VYIGICGIAQKSLAKNAQHFRIKSLKGIFGRYPAWRPGPGYPLPTFTVKKGESPSFVESTGLFLMQPDRNFVMLQFDIFQEFVERLLPQIDIVAISTECVLD